MSSHFLDYWRAQSGTAAQNGIFIIEVNGLLAMWGTDDEPSVLAAAFQRCELV